jgi:protein O-GlcNAc transferase
VDEAVLKALSSGRKSPVPPFLSIATYDDPARNLSIARSWSTEISNRTASIKPNFPFNSRGPDHEGIKVGYISQDFRDHAMTHCMLGLFGLHNRDEFEVFCYACGKDDESPQRERIKKDCDHFVDIRDRSDFNASRRIYEDRIDILVDLMGHTQGNRLEIMALRPAPLQISFLRFAGTTGADFIDYLITDRIVSPEDHMLYYSEKLIYMPHSYNIYDHTQPVSNQPMEKTDVGLPEDGFVFCSFNQPYKIEHVLFHVWMNILNQVPESVLWLLRVNADAEKNLKGAAKERGIEPERFVFAEMLPTEEHLARHRLADLALDTRIYNGHTTTCDALWMGLPVITLQGRHFASRVSASHLTTIGLPELIVHSLEAYEELAVNMAQDSDLLIQTKEKLMKNRLNSPLFDNARSVKNLEWAYKRVWEIYREGKRPEHVYITEKE